MIRATLLSLAALALPASAAAQAPSCAGRGKVHENGPLIVSKRSDPTAADKAGPLYTVKPNGGGARRLTSPRRGQVDGYVFGVSASPDGRSATFIRYESTVSVKVEIVSLRTRRARPLSSSFGALAFAPASWSPGGRAIAIADRGGGTFVVRPDGSGGHRLDPPDFGQRAYSPNGRCLVGFLANSGFALLPAGGGTPIPVPTTATGEGLRFTPDGRRIVFTARRGRTSGIYSVKLDGSGLRKLAPARNGGDAAVFSPDGRLMAYNDSKGTMVKPVAGGRARRLLKGMWVKAWAPRPN